MSLCFVDWLGLKWKNEGAVSLFCSFCLVFFVYSLDTLACPRCNSFCIFLFIYICVYIYILHAYKKKAFCF